MKKYGFVYLLFVIFFTGCGVFKISISTKRDTPPFSIDTGNGIRLTACGAVNMFGSDFFPSGFKIEAGGKIVYIDPILVDDTNSADYIFITHEHMDHLQIDDIKKLMKDNTLIICTKTSADSLPGLPVKLVKPGDSLDFGTFRCDVVPAYTTLPVFLGIVSHPAEDLKAGYIFHFGGTSIYHMGDTESLPGMNAYSNITVLLVPTSFCMDEKEAADAVNVIRPEIAVPMHYPLGETNAQKFAGMVDDGIKVVIMTSEW